MSLPNTISPVSPFDVILSATTNDMIENIEALADGSGLDDGAVTPEKILSSTGTTWTPQTPTVTWTNVTVGNGTVTSRYTQVGKLVSGYIHLLFGSTTSVTGEVQVSLPVTPNATMYGLGVKPIGTVQFFEASTVVQNAGVIYFNGAASPYVRYYRSDTVTLQTVSLNSLSLGGANDIISIEYLYFAA